MDSLDWLQNWYKSHCNGIWEKKYEVCIESIDNPGWRLLVNLNETECENQPFIKIKKKINDHDWYVCFLDGKNFDSACGPNNLIDVLNVFRNWAENCKKN